jgi:ABC-2 type transport system ATP-binding protein
LLSIKGLSKSYSKNNIKAVDNLNLEIKAGEIYGFLGPNGAGKTTTIKMIVGLLRPDSGTITVNGHDVAKESVAAKASIAFVPDTPELFDKLTGVDYLNFMGDIYGVSTSDRKARAKKLLAMFDLEAAAGDLISSYSHGMRQKMALTGALLSMPKVMVLDEPMVGLDPKSAHLFKELMNEHCASGGTVFFSTHILDVAERLCHRVGIIKGGKLIVEGTMDQLKSNMQGSTGESLENIFLELTER